MKKFINFTDDPIVNRLRSVMIAVMLFSIFNTLAGQPESFWQHPETAIRGDGLSIHNETNHSFEFFLGHGWQVYFLACAVYMVGAFLIVSILPRTAALIAIFAFLFGHYFGTCNWLVVRWHLGFTGIGLYGAVLGAAVVFPAFSASDATTAERLRWVAVFAILMDGIITLIGQPHSYWQHPETVHEGNPLSYFFLSRGYVYFCLYSISYMTLVFLLVTYLPKKSALICGLAFIFGHFTGVSNWFFYQWRMGMKAPIIYGMFLGSMIVLLTLMQRRQESKTIGTTPEPVVVS